MVRYVGDETVATLVLQRRPEAVLGVGRAQAWLCGSGIDRGEVSSDVLVIVHEAGVQPQPQPVILDGGALELHSVASGPVLITPHYGELAAMFSRADALPDSSVLTARDISRDPKGWAIRAAELWGVTVLLKGSETVVVGPGTFLVARSATPWLATAGAGDALGGIIGALVASHVDQISADPGELARIAASAAVLHGSAARRISAGGPFTILDLCSAIPATMVDFRRMLAEVSGSAVADYS
jgi:NAD(P)H-hydrate repair Nnr-like enzyme with NAD(P)H-hydrate dehydratase domain